MSMQGEAAGASETPDDATLDVKVTQAVVEETGTPVDHLEPLYTATINPDYLDRLFGGDGTSEEFVQFEYAGCMVKVFADNTVEAEQL